MPTQNSSSWEGPLQSSEVVNQIKIALLGTNAHSASSEALRADALRTVVWALNVLKQDPLHSGTTASTRRVLAQARAMWMPYFEASTGHLVQQSEPEEDAEETVPERDALEALEEQGDVFSLPGGYWLPAPLRLVHLNEMQYLLVGGLPTHLLPQTILHAACFRGSFRQINIEKSSLEALPTSTYIAKWQFQALHNWLGPSPPPLERILQDFYNRELFMVIYQDIANQLCEVYAAYLDKPQAQRWVSLDIVQDGRFLLRTRTLWGLKQYSIGVVQSHRLVLQSSQLHAMEIRRLCYALDYKVNTPTSVVWERTSGRLILRSELPARERKQMAAIGSLYVPQKAYYPREWIGISRLHVDIVEALLKQLEIRIETNNNKR